MEINGLADGFCLSSGRAFYAHGGVVGLAVGTDGGSIADRICYGWDGSVGPDSGPPFTPEELREIADYMIAQWSAFKTEIGD